MNIGTLFRAQVLKNVFGGDGIARVAGEVVFIPGTIAGEEIIGEVTRVAKDYARAVVKEIVKASPDRITPACSGMGHCPGCAYGHVKHAREQAMKLQQLRDFVKPLGLAPEAVQGYALENAPEEFYRNKLKLQMRKSGGLPQLGYVFTDGRMYPVTQCRLASKAINAKLAALYNDPGFVPSMHDRMTLTLRESEDGITMFRNSPGRNAANLTEKVLNRDFIVPPDGFFQVNSYGMNALAELVKTFLETHPTAHFIDAYAGAGLFGAVAAACGVPEISGVELDAEASSVAPTNWRNFGAQKIDFRSGDAAELLSGLLNDAKPGAVALFDPPRDGMDTRAVRTLAASPIQNVLYVSCHPATLVRDLGRLQKGGFAIEAVRMVDMFPRSAHFETFVQLSR